MKTHLILLLLLPFLLSCQHMPVGTPKTRLEQEDDIRETFFRYLFKQTTLEQKQQANAYYLAVYDKGEAYAKDPDTSLMKRFGSCNPPVKRFSECASLNWDEIFKYDLIPPWSDKKTGKAGLVFKVGEIDWITDHVVIADGRYEESSFNGPFYRCLLEMKNNRWSIMSEIEPFDNGLHIYIKLKPAIMLEKRPLTHEDDIRETVFRYLMENPWGLQGKCANAYYLSLQDSSGESKDPDVQFMQRFSNTKPPIKAASQCTTGFGSFISCKGDTSHVFGVVDRKTDKAGMRFIVGNIHWIRENFVIVEGGYYEYVAGAAWGLYFVAKEGNYWVVKAERGLVIS